VRFRGLQTGDAEVRRQHALNRRGVDDALFGADVAGARALADFALGEALGLDEHDGHAATDVVASGLEHFLAAARIQRHADLGRAFGEPRRRIGELLAGCDDVALQQDRASIRLLVELRADRHALAALRFVRIVRFVDQAELHRRGRAQHAHRLVGVLHAGKLHDDAADALPRDDRLRYAELVDAIAQRRDVLLDRQILTFLQALRSEAHAEHGLPIHRVVGDHDAGIAVLDDLRRRGGISALAQRHAHHPAIEQCGCVGNAFVA
jgi:hypothetical protein